MPDNERWMTRALELAQRAQQQGEVPVGAVIVLNNKIIGEGWNQPISQMDSTAHAEMVALRAACIQQKNYRLPEAEMYVTLEPCMMCAGALIHARISKLFYAATEPKTGAAGSSVDAFSLPNINHRVECFGGMMALQSSHLLQQFFRQKR